MGSPAITRPVIVVMRERANSLFCAPFTHRALSSSQVPLQPWLEGKHLSLLLRHRNSEQHPDSSRMSLTAMQRGCTLCPPGWPLPCSVSSGTRGWVANRAAGREALWGPMTRHAGEEAWMTKLSGSIISFDGNPLIVITSIAAHFICWAGAVRCCCVPSLQVASTEGEMDLHEIAAQ